MAKLDDKKGNRYGRLKVIEFAGTDKKQNAIWECICDCGNTVTVSASQLVTGKTRSCGCLQRESNRKNIMNSLNPQSIAKKVVQTEYKNNTSGVKGVSWHKKTGKWYARIMVNKKSISLGYFDKEDLDKAIKARKNAEIK